MNWNDVFYYKKNGTIWFKPRDISTFTSLRIFNSWRTRVSRKPAGYIETSGYIVTTCGDGSAKLYRVHRIIWEMHNGPIPKGMQIDHINHNRGDNRIENLRCVSVLENMSNKTTYKNNTSKVCGVSKRSSRGGRFCAYINKDGKRHNLGEFDSFIDACEARIVAEVSLNFHKNHGA